MGILFFITFQTTASQTKKQYWRVILSTEKPKAKLWVFLAPSLQVSLFTQRSSTKHLSLLHITPIFRISPILVYSCLLPLVTLRHFMSLYLVSVIFSHCGILSAFVCIRREVPSWHCAGSQAVQHTSQQKKLEICRHKETNHETHIAHCMTCTWSHTQEIAHRYPSAAQLASTCFEEWKPPRRYSLTASASRVQHMSLTSVYLKSQHSSESCNFDMSKICLGTTTPVRVALPYSRLVNMSLDMSRHIQHVSCELLVSCFDLLPSFFLISVMQFSSNASWDLSFTSGSSDRAISRRPKEGKSNVKGSFLFSEILTPGNYPRPAFSSLWLIQYTMA